MLRTLLNRINNLMPQDERGIRWPIRVKLSLVISSLVGVALLVIISLASLFFRRDNEVRIQESSRQLAANVGTGVSAELKSRIQNLRLLADTLGQGNRGAAERLLFENDRSLAMFGIYQVQGDTIVPRQVIANPEGFKDAHGDIQQALARQYGDFARAKNGSVIARNISQDLRIPLCALAFPVRPQGSDRIVVAVLRLDELLAMFQTGGIIKSALINEEGTILAHEDRDTVVAATSFAAVPIVKEMATSKLNNGLTQYDYNGTSYWGAFRRLDFGGLGVITYAEGSKWFEAVDRILKWNFLLMIAVICIAVIFVFFFARSFSEPVLRLATAAHEIENGNYLLNLKPETTDEIGFLTQSFASMGKGLQERENLKVSFGRFVNKELAEMAMSGELELGGVSKEVTIFFSDIRGFTTISEKLEPEEVVEMLNQYMTEMVKCVHQTNGLVDKFIGDAVMAIWGALRPHGNDALNAVTCALAMRKQLLKFNRGRGSARKPVIRIGMGINTGPVIAGQMGSSDKMDFTVIGDAVNTASRVEHLNKTYGTDILITDHTLDKAGRNLFKVEEVDRVVVRGKSKPVTLYAVLGFKDDREAPDNLKELRKLVGIEFNPAAAKKG